MKKDNEKPSEDSRIERRRSNEPFKLKETRDGEVTNRYITGYAIVFNSPSTYLGYGDRKFREVILPQAVDEKVIKKSDILMLVNHNRNLGLLARSKNGSGTLTISIDERGVYFEFEVPDTQCGNDVYESIKRGDINQASFAFSVESAFGEDVKYTEDGEILRTIKRIDELYDFSIVDFPAYEETNVDVAQRSISKYVESKKPEEKLITKKEMRMQLFKNELKRKYKLI